LVVGFYIGEGELNNNGISVEKECIPLELFMINYSMCKKIHSQIVQCLLLFKKSLPEKLIPEIKQNIVMKCTALTFLEMVFFTCDGSLIQKFTYVW
jgi:hypothetical protein